MIEVMLIRHMETEWNEQLRYIGRTDLSLSELGRENGRKLGEYLNDLEFSKLYSSSLKRTKETAAIIAVGRDMEVESLKRLNEVDFGAWEGLTHPEILNDFEDVMNSWREDPSKEQIPDGEDWTEFENRVKNEFERILASTKEGRLAIVTHAGPIKIILGNILNVPSNRYWQIYQDKGAINSVGVEGKRRWIVTVNDTCYRKVK